MEQLTLGTIIDSFGLDGTLKVYSTTYNQKLRYKKGNKVTITNDNDSFEVTVISFRSNGKFDFVKVEEIKTPEEVMTFKGYSIKVKKDQNDLKEGYYFYSDLRGCKLIDENGKQYGVVTEVEEYPAQITLRAKTENGKHFMIPFVKDFIKSVDISSKTIVFVYMEGMLWE